ncbi:MAG: beta-ketoacyl-ACP synthase [Cyanobacteria bacterium J06635_1]
MELGLMEPVVVTGVGLVSALGDDAPIAWHRLLANESAIALRQPFLELPPGPLAMIGKTPVAVSSLVETTVLAALTDAQLSSPLPDCGVVIGSSRSHQGEWEALARQRLGQVERTTKATPHPWLETLPHQTAVRAAQQVGSGGPVLAPMAACATGIWALAQGFELIRTGQCDLVIAGAVEAPITPLTLAGFAKMGAQAQTGCYPFDEAREGLVLGEGAAVIVLERASLAAQRGVPVYGEIRGFGLLNDAHHITSPAARCDTAIAAVRQCLHRSHLTPADIDFIHTHGTATQRNDQMEAAIAATIFPKNTAITATKGATGHTLGASGAMGTVFSLLALRHQQLPPCVGLKTPAFDLNFVRQTTAAPLSHAICCSFGFGGQNTAVALSRAASILG